MYIKWIFLIFPLFFLVMVASASGQSTQLSNAVAGPDHQPSNSNDFLFDTTSKAIPTDSTYAGLYNEWHKVPGQMPIYVFGLPPNSMPILTPPPVDEKMIIPIRSEKADSLKTPDLDDE